MSVRMPETWKKQKATLCNTFMHECLLLKSHTINFIERPNSNLTIWSRFFFFHRGLPFWHYRFRTSPSLLQFLALRPFCVEACRTATLPPSHTLFASVVVRSAFTVTTRFGLAVFYVHLLFGWRPCRFVVTAPNNY